MLDQEIHPGIGIGDVILGLTMDEARKCIGEPDKVEIAEFSNVGETDYEWTYSHLELELSFCQDDHYRLGSIASRSAQVIFEGARLIGLSEVELSALELPVHGSPQLDSTHDPFGRDYIWDEAMVSCWVSDGVVTYVTVMPHYEDDDDTVIWPDRAT